VMETLHLHLGSRSGSGAVCMPPRPASADMR
jgi:hypothetical protein